MHGYAIGSLRYKSIWRLSNEHYQLRSPQCGINTGLTTSYTKFYPDIRWIPYTLDHADTAMTVNNDELWNYIGSDYSAHVHV
jgi:hypothetical protein